MRDEHESEVHGVVGWPDVLGRLDDSVLQVIHENFFQAIFLRGIEGVRNSVVIFEREFRIDRNDFVFDEHHGVDDLSARERVLHLI